MVAYFVLTCKIYRKLMSVRNRTHHNAVCCVLLRENRQSLHLRNLVMVKARHNFGSIFCCNHIEHHCWLIEIMVSN